ncbi:SRPBCC family protein [Paenibacillus andongensis]|uniref:SRPBCC family protein n=1 Tax=Paenibacillus andongensis TaxID=2975482 RepID=UPI0021BAE7C8|nr:SRPBCC family protein [Paenibacillus andongensis]
MTTLSCDCGFKVEEENRYEVEAKMWHHAIHDHADMLKSMSVEQLAQWLMGKDKQLGDSSAIHQEVVFAASPNRIYEALTDAAQFSKVSGGAPTEITPEAGGSFSCFGGMIVGKNIELEPNKRIVQAWRVANWEEGVYSLVKFELEEQGEGTRLVFSHTGFPEGQEAHLAPGWHTNYWEPLKKYLA